jgi:hypothetical protein
VAMTKVEDYFYGSVHKTNILGREIIKAYYGIGPSPYISVILVTF